MPLHLIQSEFSIKLSSYNRIIKEIENELISQQQAFVKNENIENLLQRNEVCHFYGIIHIFKIIFCRSLFLLSIFYIMYITILRNFSEN